MSFFLLILVLILLGTNVYTVTKFLHLRKTLELGPASSHSQLKGPRKAINPRHELKETFTDLRISKESGGHGQDFNGWHFWCKCGTIAPAVDNDTDYSTIKQGSESGAVRAWHKHANLYAELVEPDRDEIERLKKELQAQKDSCICKDL